MGRLSPRIVHLVYVHNDDAENDDNNYALSTHLSPVTGSVLAFKSKFLCHFANSAAAVLGKALADVLIVVDSFEATLGSLGLLLLLLLLDDPDAGCCSAASHRIGERVKAVWNIGEREREATASQQDEPCLVTSPLIFHPHFNPIS